MVTFKLRRVKIGTAITTVSRSLPLEINSQYESLATLSLVAPKVMVSTTEDLPTADGLEAVRTGQTGTIKNALATYIQRFRGNEGVILCNPEFAVSRDLSPLVKYIEDNKFDLTWACHADVGSSPRFFVMSAQVVQHVWNDIDDKMTFANDWQAWLHAWMNRLLRQRYFDATQMALIEPFKKVVSTPVQPAPAPVKKQVVRKVKHTA